MAEATYYSPAWRLPGILTGIGGSLMFVGVMLFFLVIGLTIVAGQRGRAASGHSGIGDPHRPRLERLGAAAGSAGLVDGRHGAADRNRL
jgi:hypothetical protein